MVSFLIFVLLISLIKNKEYLKLKLKLLFLNSFKKNFRISKNNLNKIHFLNKKFKLKKV